MLKLLRKWTYFPYFLQGNLKFSVDGETPVIENGKLVSVIADLLSTKADIVEKALLFRTVATGRDIIDKQHTEQEATYAKNAFAKVNIDSILSVWSLPFWFDIFIFKWKLIWLIQKVQK